MEQREENHEELATSDVMSMAVKPQKLLNIIRLDIQVCCSGFALVMNYLFSWKIKGEQRLEVI